MMSEAEFAQLRDDIAANDLREAIFLADGQIADGRNRYKACLEADKPMHFREWDGTGDLTSIVVSLNLKRRHLSESQRAMVAAKLANINSSGRPAANPANLPNISTSDAATMLTISERSVRSASKVLRDGVPELIEKVESGEVSVSAAAEFAEMPKYRQKRLIKKGRNVTKKIVGRIRENALKNATKGGRVCLLCGPEIEDTDENFLAAVQLLGKQFPAHQRYLSDIVEELAQTELSDDTRESMDRILAAIRNGFSEHTDCRKASGLDSDHFDVTITNMLDYEMIAILLQGGKHDEARGARKKIYTVVDRPMPEPKDEDDDLEYEPIDDGWN